MASQLQGEPGSTLVVPPGEHGVHRRRYQSWRAIAVGGAGGCGCLRAACEGLQCWKISDDFWRGIRARSGTGWRAGGGEPHREAELVLRRSQYRTLKSSYHEHDARGLDGRVADPADLMFRSMAKNVAGMMEIWKRARGSTARGEPKVPGVPVAWGCSALGCARSSGLGSAWPPRDFLGCVEKL